MKSVVEILEEKISAAMAAVTGQQDCAAIVAPATDPKFGDYQANGVMALAKKLKVNPRKLAEEVVNNLNTDPRPPTPDPRLGDLCEPPEVAGPGFINLRLKPSFIAAKLFEIHTDHEKRLGIEKIEESKTIVVDFSGPNIAKEMHVGHLRSTIIGDCICRTLEFLGHKVIRQNHIGDWGTNFGMVVLGLWHLCMAERHGGHPYFLSELKEIKSCAEDRERLKVICKHIRDRHEKNWREDSVGELGDGKGFFEPFIERLKDRGKNDIWPKLLLVYQYVNILEDIAVGMGLTIPTRQAGTIPYESLSRHVTAMLQKKDDVRNSQEYRAWDYVRKITLEDCDDIYRMLGITFDNNTEIRGESFYNDMLPDVVEELLGRGIAEISDGAVCVFPEGFKTKEGDRLPFIIRKSDGAYLYATTDLAALHFRIFNPYMKADKIIYVTDARQIQHFKMLFGVAKLADWNKQDNMEVIFNHVTFGSVLGENGQPLKTRSGENVKLKELLDEAVERAKRIVEEKNPELPTEQKEKIAKAVGIGAVKYADFSNNRTSDYVFSFDKMLAMEGNTAPYMQYAYARIKSIERKALDKNVQVRDELAGIKKIALETKDELDLAKHLIRYGEAIEAAIADYRPNYLTTYLYELAQKFSVFYTNCPVLDASPDKRPTRLLLCDLTARTIQHGLSELLGIEVVGQM